MHYEAVVLTDFLGMSIHVRTYFVSFVQRNAEAVTFVLNIPLNVAVICD